MVCFFPMSARPSVERHPGTGKRGITQSGTKALIEGHFQTLPCGICLGCRMDRAEAWAIRCSHEAKMHVVYSGGRGSTFLTLTFDPEHLPRSNSVYVATMQDFMKRLRRDVGSDVKLRFYLAAEYGERRGRAHYHILLFGFSFPDRRHWMTVRGHQLFKSDLLSKAWPYGNALIGDVTYQSARYVAGYVGKKVGGPKAAAHYSRVSPVDGLTYQVEPEFSLMSSKPGIGRSWFEEFKSDVFPSDQVIVDGRPRKPPRYYELMLSEDELKPIKRKRRADARKKAADRTPERLAVRLEVLRAKLSQFERGID